jgi:hypothetical protein
MEPACFQGLNLREASCVVEVLRTGARALREARCREGSIDRITFPGTLIATGDLHDNPLHLATLVHRAGLMGDPGTTALEPEGPTHLVLHELIHSDRLHNGMDFSFRGLTRIAALKAAFPERVHVLLANHELAQVFGSGIVKDGIRVVDAFNEAVDTTFGDEAPAVHEAIKAFILAMPLALRGVCPRKDLLVAHSLPEPWMMSRFDATILSRELTPEDYEPRRGSAHLMVWGRGYDADQIEDLVERWGVGLIILGHEKVPEGARFVPPCVLVLNSDHDQGVFVPIDLSRPLRAEDAVGTARRLMAERAAE